MGKVLVQMRVLPEGTDISLSKLQKQITKVLPTGVTINKVVEEEVAYGLKCLKVTVIMPDAEGGTEPVETAISEIKGVNRVEVEIVSLI